MTSDKTITFQEDYSINAPWKKQLELMWFSRSKKSRKTMEQIGRLRGDAKIYTFLFSLDLKK